SASGSQTVATFTDPAGAEALADYSADIAWGDGNPSAGSVTFGGGVFTVSGSNTYIGGATCTITVTIHHDTAADATTTSSATVTDPAVNATGGFTVNAVEGSASGSQTVATFTDPGGAEALADYSADIDWGDGNLSAGAITFGGGVFTVSGSNT